MARKWTICDCADEAMKLVLNLEDIKKGEGEPGLIRSRVDGLVKNRCISRQTGDTVKSLAGRKAPKDYDVTTSIDSVIYSFNQKCKARKKW